MHHNRRLTLLTSLHRIIQYFLNDSINKMMENAMLVDKLMSELKLEFAGYSNEETKTELTQCLPDILKLDISLLQNEIVNQLIAIR